LESPDRAALAPLAQPAAPDPKEQKREAKRRRDAQRRPDSYERLKILIDVIGEQRQVVSLEDHRARYALLLMGGINAAMVLVATRVGGSGHPPVHPTWVLGLGIVYVAASLLFVLAAVDGLRPRALQRKGLLHWEGALMHSLPEYQAAWSEARMDQLNEEAATVAHMLAGLLDEKYRANRRLYAGLTVLIVLGVVLLTILAMGSRV
jgi:hypothetical protein